MLHKVLKNNWVWENFREDYTTPALFGVDYGHYLGTNLIVSLSDPKLWNAFFSLRHEYFNWMLVQWTSEMCPLSHIKTYFLGTGTL